MISDITAQFDFGLSCHGGIVHSSERTLQRWTPMKCALRSLLHELKVAYNKRDYSMTRRETLGFHHLLHYLQHLVVLFFVSTRIYPRTLVKSLFETGQNRRIRLTTTLTSNFFQARIDNSFSFLLPNLCVLGTSYGRHLGFWSLADVVELIWAQENVR